MSTLSPERLRELAQQMRDAALGTSCREMDVCVNSGDLADLLEHLVKAAAERDRLHALINCPQTAEFLSAVAAEKAHQVERWGAAHDRSKSAEHWYWLVGYLSGKALRAAIAGDTHKALHHTVSSAAALACWHEAISIDTSGAGIGQDNDLRAHDAALTGSAAC